MHHYRPSIAVPLVLLLFSLTIIVVQVQAAYSISSNNRRVQADELLGIWRLTSKASLLKQCHLLQDDDFRSSTIDYTCSTGTNNNNKNSILNKQFGVYNAMKDFTVFRSSTWSLGQELAGELADRNASVLIRLSEDGTFQALNDMHAMNTNTNANTKINIQGRWDYASEDGQLVLAPGRLSLNDNKNYASSSSASSLKRTKLASAQDTLLSGSVICLDGVVQQIYDKDSSSKKLSTTSEGTTTHHQISVPFGAVESGRFTYPPEHPSFFNTHPIYRPTTAGRFQFQKVISEIPENRDIEKFLPSQLANKRFFLTAEPTKKKKKERWSNWQKKMVEVPDKHEIADANNDVDNVDPFSASMQVMQVELFANSTFTTVGGLGQAVTLRGKWMIIGQDKDQLWMQVWRFGFGRSISGSTYSEGAQLTQNDDKGYWGQIYEVEEGRFEVRGMVMLGYGLEPTTIGKFTMIEQQHVDDDVGDGDGDDDNDEFEGSSESWGAFE